MIPHDDGRSPAATAALRVQDRACDPQPDKPIVIEFPALEPVGEPLILGLLISSISRARACTPVHAGSHFN